MGSPAGPVDAGAAAVLVAVGLLWLGFGLTGLVSAWREDLVTRCALAFPAVVALALVLTSVHVVTGGALFRSPAAVRAVTAFVAGALVLRWGVRRLRHGPSSAAGRRDLALAVGCSLLVAVVWGSPAFRLLPLASGGDIGFHSGWTEQLGNGERLPFAPLSGEIPNYYPWLYHGLLAFVTDLTPGGKAFHGLAPLQLLQTAGIAASFFGLGHLLAGRWAGAATAVLGAAAGGWGFLAVGGLDVVVDPRTAEATRYAGDLLFVRSPNVAFLNLAPPYPRDVAAALLVGTLVLVARSSRTGRAADLVAGGVVLGLAGLAQTDAFAVGVLAVAVFAALAPAGRRLRTGAAVILPALAVFSLWLAPLAVSYVRLGGFVDTTEVGPVVLPAWAILGSWGVVVPLAALGAVRAARTFGDPVVRLVFATLLAGAAAVAASSLLPALFGEGFETVGRAHRYWPLLALPLALLAGLGAYVLGAWLSARGRPAAWAVGAVVLGLALPSPVIASLALPGEFETPEGLREALEGDDDAFLNVLDGYGDGPCAAAVSNSVSAFAYTGFRFLLYGNPKERENAARIRWADIYERIAPESQRLRDDEQLRSGTATPQQLRAIVDRYGLDVVAVPDEAAPDEAFRGLRGRAVETPSGNRVVLFGLGDC